MLQPKRLQVFLFFVQKHGRICTENKKSPRSVFHTFSSISEAEGENLRERFK